MVNVAVVVCLIMLSILVVALNSGCLYIIFCTGQERRVSTLLIASLLVAHIIQGVFVIPMYAAKRWEITENTANVIVCTCFRYSYLLTNYISCIAVLIISLDRFLAIYSPLKYRVHATKSLATRIVILSWIYVLALCSIPFAENKKSCWYNPNAAWSVFMLLCNTDLPFFIIILLYSYIYRKTRNFVNRRNTRLSLQLQEDRVSLQKKRLRPILKIEIAAARVAVIISISYIICWGPSLFYYLLMNLCPKKCFAVSFKGSHEKEKLNYAMKFLTMVDGLVAPIIYCFQNAGFRRTVTRATRLRRQRSLHLSSVSISKAKEKCESELATSVVNQRKFLTVSSYGSPTTETSLMIK